MKTQFSLSTRAALSVLAAGAFCLASNARAQTSDASPSPDASATSSASATASPTEKASKSASKESSSSTTAAKATTDKTKPAASTSSTVAKQDHDFMMNAAKGGMMEVHMGQMAEKQGQSADVKKLGARMVADHTKVNNQLMTLAQAKGVKLDTRHKMDKIDAANFDQMWLVSMVKDHQKDVAAFQTEAKSGADPELKAFASKNLPTLQKHLQLVQAAQAKVGKGSNTASPAPKKS
jgi:putative membrane protein